MKGETLEQLLKSHKITQRTYDRVTIAKDYIERKYNLKSIINIKWNNIIEKINTMNISENEKNKIINEINHQKGLKTRKNREKQTIHEYESLSIIGRGAFGEVHVCREIKTGNIYAIKKIKKETLIKKNQIIHIRSEQLFMSKVKSPWIVDLKASFQEGDYLYLVMEFLPGGDLMSLLIKKDILTEDEARFYIAELILAVDSIHKLDCIHRDIKPDNVLIDKNGHIKLSDFGLAKVSDKLYENYKYENFNKNKLTHKKNYSCVGTAYYVAPEVLNKSGYGKDIDWWSVGVIFFEMLVGYAPFCSEETKEVCYKVINWQKFLKIPDDIKISKEAEDLIFKMINNSDKRLGRSGIEEIKVHPFFKGLDWDNIRSTKAPFIPDIKNDYDTKYFEHFDVEEPFYPPQKKIKRRKDIEFLGYTYKDENEVNDYDKDVNEINEIYKEVIKRYEDENKEKSNTTLSQSKDKINGKSIKKINTYIKAGELNIDGNKNILQKNNIKNAVTMIKKSNNLKVGISSRNKGKSPPLFSKININKSQIPNQQPQRPLKKIKIVDKKNAKLNKTFNKSENNSKNKYVKMKINVNKAKEKMRISPLLTNKKLDNSMNSSQRKIIGNKTQNTSFKKATSLKSVKDDDTKEMNFTMKAGRKVYGLNELNNKIMVVKKIV